MCGLMRAFAQVSVAKRSAYFAVKAKELRKVNSYRSGGHVTSPASQSVADELSVTFGICS